MRFQTMLMAGVLAAGPGAVLAQDSGPIIGRTQERVATVNDPPRISLWAADPYGRDSRPRVYFRTDASAYVTVLALYDRGEMRVIYPRSPASTARVRSNQEVIVQVPWMGRYEGSSYGGRVTVLAIASPVPFDFSDYARGRSWRNTQLAGMASYDPEVAVEEFANRTIPDPDVHYSYEILSLGDRRNDRYSSRSRGYGDCYSYSGYSGYSDYSRHLYPAYAYANYVHLSAFHPWMFGLTSYGYGDCYGTPYRFVILVPPRSQIPTPPRDTTRRAIPKWTKIGSQDSARGPGYEPVSGTPPVEGTFPPGRGRRTDPAIIDADGGNAQPNRDPRAVHTGNAGREPDRAPIVTRDEPRQSEPTRAEPRQTEPKYEPVRSDPVRSEPTRSEPRQAEPRYEPVRSEPVRSEPPKSEPPRSEPARSEPSRSEPARSESKRSEPARSESKRSETKRSEPSRSQPRTSSSERRSVLRKN